MAVFQMQQLKLQFWYTLYTKVEYIVYKCTQNWYSQTQLQLCSACIQLLFIVMHTWLTGFNVHGKGHEGHGYLLVNLCYEV